MQFQLPKIIFNFGAVARLKDELALMGVKRPLLASDKGLKAAGAVDHVLKANGGVDFVVHADVPENPTTAGCEDTARIYREQKCDGLIALGGGSVIDTVKAAAVIVTSGKPLEGFLNRPDLINFTLAPIITIPTTSGSGSEVSFGSGIHPDAHSRAMSAASVFSLPRLAICDPELTVTLPPRLTAATGIDALSHCLEGYLSKTDNPFVDAMALDGMKRAFHNVERATKDGSDKAARAAMLMASSAGGISIHKGLGPVHAFAGVFGDRGFHHGTLVSIALPGAMRLAEARVPEKMKAIAQALGLEAGARVSDAIAALNGRLGLPQTLSAHGYGDYDFEEAVEATWKNRFNLTSPFEPTRDEIAALVRDAFG